MRPSCLLACLLGSGAVACGGGSNSPPVPGPAADAAPADTAATVCSQQGTLNATTALNFGTGGRQATGAVPNNATELTVTAIVTNQGAPTTGFIIIQVNNAGVFGAATGAAGRFEKPPTPGTYPMDTDANLGFGIDFVDGITANADGTATVNAKQVAILDATAGGTVSIDSWTPAATPGGTSTIGATFTNAKFVGHNVLASGGLDQTANGCDITVQKLQFTNLTVKWQTAAFPTNVAGPVGVVPQLARPGFATHTLDGAAALQADYSLAP